jgi:hypothetical protein
MTPQEFWLMVDARHDVTVYGNGMTGAEVREIYEETYGSGRDG